MKNIITTKNKEGIEIDGYRYRPIKQDKSLYRCTNKLCKAQFRIKNNIKTFKNNHSCSKNGSIKILAKGHIVNLSKTHLTPLGILNSTIDKFDLEQRHYLQSNKSMKRIVRETRALAISSVVSFEFFPLEYTKTSKGNVFLQYLNKIRSISIFFDEQYIKMMSNSKFCVADGTFRSVPSEFTQLYTIHFEIMGKVFPMVYIFLNSKEQILYEEAFGFLATKGIFSKNIRYIVDYEIAPVNALKKIFESVYIEFCLFHYSQSIFRRMQKLGFVSLYKNDNKFRTISKQIFALPFLKPTDIREYFKKLKDKAIVEYETYNIKGLFEYIEKIYIGKSDRQAIYSLYDLSLFCRIERGDPLTTNISEGWHRGLNSSLNEYHPNLGKVLDFIVKNNSLVEREVLKHLKRYICDEKPILINEKARKLKCLAEKYEFLDKDSYIELILSVYTFKEEDFIIEE